MKLNFKKFSCILFLIMLFSLSSPLFAVDGLKAGDETEESTAIEKTVDGSSRSKAWAAALCIALVASAGAIGMAIAIAKSVEGIARQPEAEGKIRTSLMLGLVFVETAIIYALIVAILIIFVL